MTIASAVAKSGPYAGNGSQTVFAYTFKVFAASELQVVLRSAGGIETPQTLTTHYTVSGVGNDGGGNVTMVTAPPAGATLTIVRNVPFVQLTDLRNQGGFYPEVHERVFDRLTQQTQQLKDGVDFSLRLPVSTPSGVSTTLPSPAPEKLIGWNAAGTGLQNFDASVLATLVAYGTGRVDLFDGDGVTTQFTLTSNPGNQSVLDVSIGGATQRAGVDFVWTGGTTLTFIDPPPAGTDNILARYFQSLPGIITESQDVTFTQAGAGAVVRTARDKMRDVVSVKDFGAVGDGITDDTQAFSMAAAASKTVYVPEGNYNLAGAPNAGSSIFELEKGAFASGVYGAVSPLADANGGVRFVQLNSAQNEYHVLGVRRQANHVDGTPGFVSAGFRSDVFVGPSNTNFEWSIVGYLYNQASGGENVGVYAKADKAGSGKTWGAVAEVRDVTNSANPTGATVGLEVDVFANGSDANNNRIGIDVVVGQGVTGVGNQACAAFAGLRIDARNATGDLGSFQNGIVVNNGTFSALSVRNSGTIGIHFSASANLTVGIDLSPGVFSGSAIRLARGQKIAFENTNTISQYLDSAVNIVRWDFSGNECIGLNLSSNPVDNFIRIAGSKIIGVRDVGWASMTGAANKGTAYATSTITLTQLAERVKSIQDALATHGLIGA